MKTTLALALILAAAFLLSAQDPQRPPPGRFDQGGKGGQKGPPGRQGQGGGFGGEGFRPPMHPLEQALDANGDGVIDAKELSNAAAALKRLDKNGDGRLTEDEYRPARPGGSGFGGPGGQGGGPGGFGGPEGQGGGFGGPAEPGGRPGAEDRPRANAGGEGEFAARLFQNDKNNDGKLSREELPDQIQRMFERLDTNGDGVIDRKEAEAFGARLRARSGGGPGQADDKRPPLEK